MSSASGYRGVKVKRGRRGFPGRTSGTKKDLRAFKRKRVSVSATQCYLSPPRPRWAEQYLVHGVRTLLWALCFSTVPQAEVKHHFSRTTAL